MDKNYQIQASGFSKNSIFVGIAAGIIFNIITKNLFSLSSLLLILPGIFIISFLSMPAFLLKLKLRKILPESGKLAVVLGIIFIAFDWIVIDVVYPAAIAIGLIKLVNLIT